MRVGLLHPGEMGAAIGALLVDRGHEVLWLPRGRSEETARRAAAAGLTSADDLKGADVVLSVAPPHAALDVARSVQGTPALVIDANAVSPTTAMRIGDLLVRLQAARRDRSHIRVQIVEEYRHHRTARTVGVLHDVHRPVFGERPHRLGVVGKERRLSEQSLVPRSGGMVVAHTEAGEQVQ